jgi:hypothetical protein
MELDGIEPAPLAVEGLEARRVLVGDPPALESLRAAADGPERREALGGMGGPLAIDRLQQRAVAGEEVDVLQRRALVGDFVRGEWAGHGRHPGLIPWTRASLSTAKPVREPSPRQLCADIATLVGLVWSSHLVRHSVAIGGN